ncbi:MAG TPA: hypothetical protein VFO65_14830, partial [Acidimicrobiales bacterium]|nr:hypothetical protein [Acidimicrobiales bacterium]
EAILAAARRGEEEITVAGHGISLTVPLARLRQDLGTSYAQEMGQVGCPALVLHGGDDLNVGVLDALTSYRVLTAAGNERVDLVVLAGLDHYFVPSAPDRAGRLWERLSLEALRCRPMAPAALAVITTWARATLAPAGGRR